MVLEPVHQLVGARQGMSTTVICDVCKDRHKEAQRAQIWTGHMQPDPAGGPLTQEMLTKDFCLGCAIKALERQCLLTGGGLR